MGKAVQKVPVPASALLYGKIRVSAAPANSPFERKVYIGAAQPTLYTGICLLIFTAAPKAEIVSIRLFPSLE